MMVRITPDDDRTGSQTRFCHAKKSSSLPTEAALEGQWSKVDSCAAKSDLK
jgi:hypothetical protein